MSVPVQSLSVRKVRCLPYDKGAGTTAALTRVAADAKMPTQTRKRACMFPKNFRIISTALLAVGLIVAIFALLVYTHRGQARVAAAQNQATAPAAAPAQQLPPGVITYTAKVTTT